MNPRTKYGLELAISALIAYSSFGLLDTYFQADSARGAAFAALLFAGNFAAKPVVAAFVWVLTRLARR